MTQTEALTILKTGKNVFITGPAGSGKTYVVNQYIRYLKDHDVPIGITASTGIAATHMGGVTIHSWAGIGIKDRLHEYDLQEISEKKPTVKKKIEAAKVLFIDEVSMLHHFRLDMVDKVLRHIKKSDAPFGGIQVVLCGDFFQLPPISRMGEPDAHFIYRSEAWKKGNFAVCYLSENYRQGSDPSLSILNEIRAGKVSDHSKELLRGRYKTNPKSQITNNKNQKGYAVDENGYVVEDEGENEEQSIDISATEILIEPTRLYTHNIDVDSVNETQLEKVSGYETVYEMETRGKKPLVETLKKSCLAPDLLRLKKGARVMCVKNNFDKGYVNGTLGVVVNCGFGIDPVIRTASTPDFPDGRLVTIEQAEWSIEDDGKILAQLTQYPLRLAWAITVHKSQGMSLDAIEVDLSKSFEPGMGYVALSRVRTLVGLTILGLNEHALKVHPDVLEYDKELRRMSDKAEQVVQYADTSEIAEAQKAFIGRVAPLHSYDASGHKVKIPKPAKVSTIEKTARCVREGMTLPEIARARDMTMGTIIAHLEELVALPLAQGGIEVSDIMHFKKEIPPSHFAKIEKALEEVSIKQNDDKAPLMSPTKSKAGNNVSFRDIQLARVLLGYIKRKSV
jgi:ATP-dependent DNA helicase PIF1